MLNLLENTSRYNIYTYIVNNPGAYFREIVENTALNRGTVQYHLQILETKNKIEAYEDEKKQDISRITLIIVKKKESSNDPSKSHESKNNFRNTK